MKVTVILGFLWIGHACLFKQVQITLLLEVHHFVRLSNVELYMFLFHIGFRRVLEENMKVLGTHYLKVLGRMFIFFSHGIKPTLINPTLTLASMHN